MGHVWCMADQVDGDFGPVRDASARSSIVIPSAEAIDRSPSRTNATASALHSFVDRRRDLPGDGVLYGAPAAVSGTEAAGRWLGLHASTSVRSCPMARLLSLFGVFLSAC